MRVEALGGLERRRRWSQDDKARIVKETLAPGAKVTAVARRNGVAASLVFMGHALMENRNGLAVLGGVSQATGTAEREIALAMIDGRRCAKRITLGADKVDDVTQFVHDLRDRSVTRISRLMTSE
jgi:transposase-like protein